MRLSVFSVVLQMICCAVSLPLAGTHDDDVVEQLEALLAEARSGEVVGLVAAIHYGGSQYAFLGSGSLVDNPDLGIAASIRLCNKLK